MEIMGWAFAGIFAALFAVEVLLWRRMRRTATDALKGWEQANRRCQEFIKMNEELIRVNDSLINTNRGLTQANDRLLGSRR